MIKGFVFICSIVAIIYLINLVAAIIGLLSKKRSWKARVNPYTFFSRLFRNFNDGYGTDVRIGIFPIIGTIMTVIGLLSILSSAVVWLLEI
ncbi:MAG: hypothetical protein H7X94_12060 [Vallitaleaceae bacterium]|nr:hypothetical protein [Vallitaleaceae bacterium]